jgi:hypothetical protein
MIHELKTWPRYFEAVVLGRKTFELRKADRTFVQGDTLILREWDPESGEYTGRSVERRITYVTDASAQAFGMVPGFVCLGLDDGDHDRIQTELDVLAEDLRQAAGDLPIALPEPGTDAARLVLANRIMRRERDEAQAEVGRLREVLELAHREGNTRAVREAITRALKTEHNASR